MTTKNQIIKYSEVSNVENKPTLTKILEGQIEVTRIMNIQFAKAEKEIMKNQCKLLDENNKHKPKL